MKLYWSSRSPFARKVTLVAHELGLADRLELEPVVVTMNTVNPEVAAVNPLTKLPTLILDDGSALYDSRVICGWLQSMNAATRLFPEDEEAYWDALVRQSLGDGLLDMLLLWRTERRRPAEQHSPAYIAAYEIKFGATLDALEQDALEETPFGIGHVSVGCALAYLDFRAADFQSPLVRAWRDGRPRLTAWFETFSARPSARATAFSDED